MSDKKPMLYGLFERRAKIREELAKRGDNHSNIYELMEQSAKNRFKKQLIHEVEVGLEDLIKRHLQPIISRLEVLELLGSELSESKQLEREVLDMLKLELGKK